MAPPFSTTGRASNLDGRAIPAAKTTTAAIALRGPERVPFLGMRRIIPRIRSTGNFA